METKKDEISLFINGVEAFRINGNNYYAEDPNDSDVFEKVSKEEFKRISEKYKEIIQNANKFYDMVFVDVESGLENEKSKEILDISDLIVYNVEQRLDMINEFNEFSKKNDKKNYILNIGRYDSFSKYSIKNMSRYTKIRRDICAIPYSTLYFEAAGEESVADLFLKIRMLDSADRNANFMNLIKDATEKIIYKLQELQMKERRPKNAI